MSRPTRRKPFAGKTPVVSPRLSPGASLFASHLSSSRR